MDRKETSWHAAHDDRMQALSYLWGEIEERDRIMAQNNDAPGDLRKFCELGGMACPAAAAKRKCTICGEEYLAPIGSGAGLCDGCEIEYGSSDRYARWIEK